VVVETHVVVLPFGVLWATTIVPNSTTNEMVQSKAMVVMLELNAKF
jgi:hypothetical protein